MNWLLVFGLAWAGTFAWAVTSSLRLAEARIRWLLDRGRADDALARERDEHAATRQERAEAARAAAREIARLTAALDQAQAAARDAR